MHKRKPPAKLRNPRQVSDRLSRVLSDVFGGDRQRMANECDLDPNTMKEWFGGKPVVPALPLLAQIAEKANVSLDWLVLGREPKPPLPVDPSSLYQSIQEELEKRHGVDPATALIKTTWLHRNWEEVWEQAIQSGADAAEAAAERDGEWPPR